MRVKMNAAVTCAAICAATMALSACGDTSQSPSEPEAVEQGGTATGDVLGGSISDDMIALEGLRSQSPTLGKNGMGDDSAPSDEADGQADDLSSDDLSSQAAASGSSDGEAGAGPEVETPPAPGSSPAPQAPTIAPPLPAPSVAPPLSPEREEGEDEPPLT